MSSTSFDFLSGLELYFITKRLIRVQHKILVEKVKTFGGTVSERITERTTHMLFPRGVNYQSGLESLKSVTLKSTVSLVRIDWRPGCFAQRKLIPTDPFKVKYLRVETIASSSVVEGYPKKILFILSGTSKFPAAKDVVGQSGKEVILRNTLAYGSKYGIGVFCLLESGEKQIGWVPEKDKKTREYIGTKPKLTEQVVK